MQCKDSSTGLMWSEKACYNMSWEMAVNYCDELKKSGYSDWRMPDIDELKNCSETETGGECPISESDGVLSQLYVTSCMGCGYGSFDKLNDADIFWCHLQSKKILIMRGMCHFPVPKFLLHISTRQIVKKCTTLVS